MTSRNVKQQQSDTPRTIDCIERVDQKLVAYIVQHFDTLPVGFQRSQTSIRGCRMYGRWTGWCRERWGLFGRPLMALQWRQRKRVEGKTNSTV